MKITKELDIKEMDQVSGGQVLPDPEFKAWLEEQLASMPPQTLPTSNRGSQDLPDSPIAIHRIEDRSRLSELEAALQEIIEASKNPAIQ